MIGRTISHYKILEKLGSGSMGTVYKAEDTKLKRIVALKFLPPHLITGKTEKHRFLHEAQAASALNHPNIITIFDIVDEIDKIFVVMEYCAGKMLTEKLKDGPLKQREVLDIAIEVAEGLNAAHKADITHRDIKSQNIIISDDCPPKIIDFGIAKQMGMTDITKDGTTLGTQCYMSPEQLHGSKVDKRSDIFSFGVVLYEMATGKLPFTGKHDAEILYSVVNEDPIPITTLNPNMDEELQRIVSKAMKKNVKDRYQHADEMLADLRNLRKKKKPPKTTKNHSWWRISTYITTVLIAALLLYTVLFRNDNSTIEHNLGKKSIAVLPFTTIDRTEESEIFGEGIHDDILTQIAKIHDLKVIARTSVIKYRDTDKGINKIAKELDVSSILEGSVRRAGDKIRIVAQLIDPETEEHIWAETYDREYADIFAIQSEVAQKIAFALKANLTTKEETAIEQIPTHNLEAYEYYVQGKIVYDTDYNHSINYFEKAIELDPTFAEAYALLFRAYLLSELREFILTDESLKKIKKTLDTAIELDPENIEVIIANAYYHYFGLRKYDKALNLFNSVLQFRPNDNNVLSRIIYIKSHQGKYEEALKLAINSVNLDPGSYLTNINVGSLASWLHKYDLAEQYLNRATLINPKDPSAYYAKIRTAFRTGNIDEARKILNNALEHIEPNKIIYMRFDVEYFSGNYAEALNILDEYKSNEPDIADLENIYYKGLITFLNEDFELSNSYFNALLELSSEEIHNFKRYKSKTNQAEWILHAYNAFAYAYLGIKDKTMAKIEDTSNLIPDVFSVMDEAQWAYMLAHIFIQIGEYERAIEQLDFVLSKPGWLSVKKMTLDKRYDPLLDNPRFQAVLEKYDGDD
ncbi:protein kinase [Candidatus Neomarinimicrobiota bacterium]